MSEWMSEHADGKSFQEYSVEHMTILDLYLVNVEAFAESKASLGYTVSSKISLDGRGKPLPQETNKQKRRKQAFAELCLLGFLFFFCQFDTS